MTEEQQLILLAIEEYLTVNPNLRFGQALFNLDIVGFKNSENPEESNYAIRDIHADSDHAILERISKRIKWLEFQDYIAEKLAKIDLKSLETMTVNERLVVSGLLTDFEHYKSTNPQFARYILELLNVDSNAIISIVP